MFECVYLYTLYIYPVIQIVYNLISRTLSAVINGKALIGKKNSKKKVNFISFNVIF